MLSPQYDLIIRGGTLVDGTGEAARRADIAIRDGVIAAVGKVEGEAARTIDATGLTVTPGFVDIHTHYDGQATWDPNLSPSCYHGVTTVVLGNCGVGFAPVHPDKHTFLIELMEGVEDIPGAALSEGIKWDWETFPEYLDALEQDHRHVRLVGFSAQMNMLAFGFSAIQPILCRPSIITSLRDWYIIRISSTQSCGPFSAAQAAICNGWKVP